MARDTDALKIEKWAASGDVEDPEDGGMTRSAGWDATYSQPGGSLPKREHFNQLFRELTALALEVNTRGCGLEWSAEISYLHPAFVTDSGGKFYFSVQDSTNVDPTGDANNATWTPDITEVPEAPGSATVDDEGLVELATGAETQTGTDDDKAVTPASLASRTATTIRAGLVELASGAETATGTDTARAVTPAGLLSRTATEARAGIVELATDAETETGTDTARVLTPANLASLLPGKITISDSAPQSTDGDDDDIWFEY